MSIFYNLHNFRLKNLLHKLFCFISSLLVVYNVFYIIKPDDLQFYINFIETTNTFESVLQFSLLSFDIGFLLIKMFAIFGNLYFFSIIVIMLTKILYSTNSFLSNFFILQLINLFVFSIPIYLPSIFLVSTLRQLISLYFFILALNKKNKYFKYLFFLISFLAHFTGIINVLILLIITTKKYNFYKILLIPIILILYFNIDLLIPLFNKIEHYSDDSETFLSLYKMITCLFIGIISILRVFYKNQIIDKYIFIYIILILFSSFTIPSISLRLFNSIYFIFIIYSLNFMLDILLYKKKFKSSIYEN